MERFKDKFNTKEAAEWYIKKHKLKGLIAVKTSQDKWYLAPENYKKLYRQRYSIAFYNKHDELCYEFDNIKQIADYLNYSYDSKEFKTLKARISNCFKKNKVLNTRFMYIENNLVEPFLIDQLDDDEDIKEEIRL